MDKKTIALIFGGQSSEHVVSCMSALNIAKLIDVDKYELLLIGITQDGSWIKVDSIQDMSDGIWKKSESRAYLLPDASKKSVLIFENENYREEHIDVVFPVLHGLYGEDGTIQGLCELARFPYVGCGVLASAVGMDKLYTKIIVDDIGIRQAAFEAVSKYQIEKDINEVIKRVEKKFEYPVFVKPSNAGSSKGVNKAVDEESLRYALLEAAKHDRKILVEETIVGHEVECAVLGGGKLETKASGVGKILAAADFYDFEAKYYNSESQTILDPDLPGDASRKVPELAKRIFDAIDGFGLSRVDFFVTASGEIIFNEINTMPGFTAISMYPMLWEAEGIDKKTLVQNLIDLAYERV